MCVNHLSMVTPSGSVSCVSTIIGDVLINKNDYNFFLYCGNFLYIFASEENGEWGKGNVIAGPVRLFAKARQPPTAANF